MQVQKRTEPDGSVTLPCETNGPIGRGIWAQPHAFGLSVGIVGGKDSLGVRIHPTNLYALRDALERAIRAAEQSTLYADGMRDAMRERILERSGPVPHEHRFGPFELSRFAGTVRRECRESGCRIVTLDGEEA